MIMLLKKILLPSTRSYSSVWL